MSFFYWLCQVVTRRECREARLAVQQTLALASVARAARLEAQRNFEQTLTKLI